MTKTVVFLLLFALTHASLALLYPFSLRRLLLTTIIYGSGTAVMLYLLFYPRNQWLVANRSQVNCATGPCVALTFDDGPSPSDTPKLLDILREKQVTATFFVVGERAERHPEIVGRACAEGHVVANHTWSHPNLFCFLTPARLRKEIEQGEESIQRICGYRPRYFRSPVGLRHPLLGPDLRDSGLEYISWRIRTWDTFGPKSETIAERILGKVAPGDIIMLHDNLSGGAHAMLEALPHVIDQLRSRGFEFVPVGNNPAVEANLMPHTK